MKDEKKILNIESLASEQGTKSNDPDQGVKKVVVIGAGTMGQGISQLVAWTGRHFN